MSPATRTTATPALPSVEVGDWRELAVCREVDPELFHPEVERGRAYEAQVAAAKRVCGVCPVRAQCLAFALRALPYGIAGGTSPEERRGLPRTGAAVSTAEFVDVSVRGSQTEIAAAGRAALAAGRDLDEVARRCGVSRRTAQRWAAAVRNQMMEVSV
ncbi:MAG: WhiB family transcriptional regulator [Dehalococcoidia bacterium]